MRRYFISLTFFLLAAVLLGIHIYCEACAAQLADMKSIVGEVEAALVWFNRGNLALIASFVCVFVAALFLPVFRSREKAAFVVGLMIAYNLVSLLLTIFIVY